MKRLEQTFAKLKAANRAAFIPFTILGFPDYERCLESIKCMIDNGASALELGLPFSDPIADGPIIQAANHATLSGGFTTAEAFALIAAVRKYNSDIPINLLVYYNLVLAPGIEKFCAKAAEAGADSILVADLPLEHAQELAPLAVRHQIAPVFLVSPLTSAERLKEIGEHARGYLYAVSRLGTTGIENRYDPGLPDLIARARELVSLPICVGFGISEAVDAQAIVALGADGVITGSRVINLIQKTKRESLSAELSAYVTGMVSACQIKTEARAGT